METDETFKTVSSVPPAFNNAFIPTVLETSFQQNTEQFKITTVYVPS